MKTIFYCYNTLCDQHLWPKKCRRKYLLINKETGTCKYYEELITIPEEKPRKIKAS